MSAPVDLTSAFTEIDKNGHGFISFSQLQSSPHYQSLFQSTAAIANAFIAVDDKMNRKDFQLLYNAHKLKFYDLAIAKFQFAQSLSKFLSVSAPGQAGPSVKQSYVRITANSSDAAAWDKQHYLQIGFGVDKPHQQQKIHQLSNVFGRNPHRFLILLKLKTNKNGQTIAQNFKNTLQGLLQLAQAFVPGMEHLFEKVQIDAKYSNGFTYIIVQANDPFIDGIIDYLSQFIQAVSPECILNFKTRVGSNVKNLLKPDFDVSKSGGSFNAQFDIDAVTLRKIKDVYASNIPTDGLPTPIDQLIPFLLEQLKLEGEFDNVGQAVQSTLQINSKEVVPYNFLQQLKGMNLKEMIGQFTGPGFLDTLKESCEFEGEFSINFHDIYFKVTFDLDLEGAFDLI